jgi:hypothetical protein
MILPILIARLQTDRLVQATGEQLRGFIGRQHPESVLLHQHSGSAEGDRFVYVYPRVQYRVRQGIPELVGLAEGIAAVLEASRALSSLYLAGRRYTVERVVYEEGAAELREETNPVAYRFTAPWLALNQKNHARYQDATPQERTELLRGILVGNVLSLCKSLGLVVFERLQAAVDVYPLSVRLKNRRLLGFLGRFAINFRLCPDLGLGHLVSIGFGQLAMDGASLDFEEVVR